MYLRWRYYIHLAAIKLVCSMEKTHRDAFMQEDMVDNGVLPGIVGFKWLRLWGFLLCFWQSAADNDRSSNKTELAFVNRAHFYLTFFIFTLNWQTNGRSKAELVWDLHFYILYRPMQNVCHKSISCRYSSDRIRLFNNDMAPTYLQMNVLIISSNFVFLIKYTQE